MQFLRRSVVSKKLPAAADLIDLPCDHYDYSDVSSLTNLHLINILLIVYISNSNNIFQLAFNCADLHFRLWELVVKMLLVTCLSLWVLLDLFCLMVKTIMFPWQPQKGVL